MNVRECGADQLEGMNNSWVATRLTSVRLEHLHLNRNLGARVQLQLDHGLKRLPDRSGNFNEAPGVS
jgi:hypothetical protein